MRIVREWIHRLWGTLRPGRRDGDLEQELRLHLEMAADEARRGGLNAAEANRAARLKAGGASLAIDALRDQRGLPWLDDWARDVRHGLRTLGRTPGFTGVALVTLALGIGANSAIFSIVNGVILRPLVYSKPEQLVRLTAQYPVLHSAGAGLSNLEYVEFQEMNQSFVKVGAFTTGRVNTGGGSGAWAGEVNLTAGDRALRVRSAAVDEHLLDTLRVQPAHGRVFRSGETDAMAARPGLGGPPLAILSHELWQSAFGGQPLVGRTVNIDGRPHEIIGIMPPGIDLMDSRPEIWLPIGIHPATRQIRNSHVLNVIGRLKDGVTLQAAQTELDGFLENWGERAGVKGHVPTKHPLRAEDHLLQLRPLQDAIVADASRTIWVLQAAVGLVLLIGCANLVNLAMARAESRRREFAVRTALGASRGRLLRQAMTEALLLSAAGAVIGLGLARAGVRALVLAYPTSLPRTADIAVDLPVLFFAMVVSIGSGLLFGLAPVGLRCAGDLVSDIKEGGDRGVGGSGRHFVRRALVITEVALALLLVTSAALLLRTVYNLAHVDAGFDRSRLLTFSMTLPRSTTDAAGRAQLYQGLLDTLRAAPGVEGATALSDLPLSRVVQGFTTLVEDFTAEKGQTSAIVDYYQFVMSDYFETMGIPIVAGRGFERADISSSERVVVVNETLANRLWKDRSPIGQRLRPNLSASMGTSDNPWHRVIGVAKDVAEGGVDRNAGSELYLFADQPAPLDGTDAPWVASAPPTMHVMLRTSLPAAALAQTLEGAVRNADPAVPMVRLREMDAVFKESIRRPRLLAELLGGFAGLALLLAAVGTYGVLSYTVTERRREIGVRMALGASRSSVIGLVMKQGLQSTITGVVVGVAGAVAVNRMMATLLFGVRATDPTTLTAVTMIITLVAAVACWLPAWRASRLDPNVVLRAD